MHPEALVLETLIYPIPQSPKITQPQSCDKHKDPVSSADDAPMYQASNKNTTPQSGIPTSIGGRNQVQTHTTNGWYCCGIWTCCQSRQWFRIGGQFWSKRRQLRLLQVKRQLAWKIRQLPGNHIKNWWTWVDSQINQGGYQGIFLTRFLFTHPDELNRMEIANYEAYSAGKPK